MATDQETSYDELPYGDNCFSYTHPDHLATVGTLFGIDPPPVEGCRVLELGCAGGGNLIPMALELPGSRFVGIDLSPRQVAAGKAIIGELGLSNIELHAMSLMAVDESFELFDYIVCHGVYSWVPEAVRDKILSICSERLSPNGIAYVSYNTYPGWHARGMIREMMAFHVRGAETALDRVERARDFLDEMVRVIPDSLSAFARILRTEGEFLQGVGNSYLYHEHLEETNHPFYFHEFNAQANAKGLRYLAEARTPGLIETLPAEARGIVEQWADDEIAREQYFDFLCNRTFRRSLLCHASQPRRETASFEALHSLWSCGGVIPAAVAPDVAGDAPLEFRKPDGTRALTTNNPWVKTALTVLHEVRPRSIRLDDLCEQVRARLGRRDGAADGEPGDSRILEEALLRCFLLNLIDLHLRPPRFASVPGERPLASPLARLQIERGNRVTNLRRRAVDLDEFDRLVVRHLDGSRTRGEVLDALKALIASDDFTIYQGDEAVRDPETIERMLSAELEPCLRRLAGSALLSD